MALAAAHAQELGSVADQIGCLHDLLANQREAVNREVAKAARDEKAADIAAWKNWIADNIEKGRKERAQVLITARGVATYRHGGDGWCAHLQSAQTTRVLPWEI